MTEPNKFDNNEEVLNLGQLADRWKVDRSTASKMANARGILYHIQGNSKRFFISDVRDAENKWLSEEYFR